MPLHRSPVHRLCIRSRPACVEAPGDSLGERGAASASRRRPAARPLLAAVGVVAMAVTGSLLGTGCSGGKKSAAAPQRVTPDVQNDTPPVLRGTIGSMARVRGAEPLVASGIGLVVGLNGTGGQFLNEAVAVTLEREMALQGVGQPDAYKDTAFDGKTPREIIFDPNVAAVVVEAAVPPGTSEGDTFDVVVRALNATSLEGGRLLTTDLRLGDPQPFGGRAGRIVGQARGEIFVNPFAEPGREVAGVTRTIGRILDGGVSRETLRVVVELNNPSHGRARFVTSAINARFPRRSGEAEPVARGRDEQLILVRMPREFRSKPGEFIQTLIHMQVDQSAPQIFARQYTETLKSSPYLGLEMTWALQGLGERSLPFARELYEYPEIVPRLAALRAGAALGDARAAPALRDIALNGPENVRTDAIELLGRLDAGPTVDEALRALLSERTLTLRIAAYEALASRAERAQVERLAARAANRETKGLPVSRSTLEQLAARRLPAGTIQGVSRLLIADKFLLDRVPFGDPLIYVSQQGTPRIALFGTDLSLKKPLLVSAWSDRLMMIAETPSDKVRVFYRRPAPSENEPSAPPVQHEAGETVTELIDFMAHKPTPESPRPGLDLTYSEIVGALYELFRQGGTDAAFATERDRLVADLIAANTTRAVETRPIAPGRSGETIVFDRPAASGAPAPTAPVVPGREGKPLLVPIPPKEEGSGKGKEKGK